MSLQLPYKGTLDSEGILFEVEQVGSGGRGGSGGIAIAGESYGVDRDGSGGIGVSGASDSGVGVQGTSKSGPGVYGESPSGEGVHGETNSNDHGAIVGIANAGAPAGYFQGSVQVTKNVL